MIAWSRGSSKTDNAPQQRTSEDFDAFIAAINQDRAREKGLAYFAAPFAQNGGSTPHRSKDTVLPCEFIILDFDKLTPEELPELKNWLKRYYGAGWATHSSTASAPKMRAVLQLSRPSTRHEIIHINSVIASDLREEFGIELDAAQFKPEQPAYMPPPKVEFAQFWGEPIDVDRCLNVRFPESSAPAFHNGADGGSIKAGGRNQTLTKIAGSMRRLGATGEAIYEMLGRHNAEHCAPPLPDAEVRSIAKSVGRYDPAPHESEERAVDLPRRLDLVALAATDPQKPKFIVADWLPQGEVTLMGAHGGTGKSMIGLQLGVAIATGKNFFGIEAQQRKVAFLSYEDSEAVLHWRLSRVCEWTGVSLSAASETLAVFDGSRTLGSWFAPYKGECGPTREYFAIEQALREFEVLIVDGSSDTFAANENDRGQVKAFIRLLKRLVPDTGALLLLAHVDKLTARAGATSQGYSGSTGWHNGPRARWYVRKDEESDDLILELQKSNSGRAGAQVKLAWDPAAHVFDGRIDGASSFDRKHQRDSTKDALMRCFRYCAAQKIDVPAASSGPRNALNVLSACPDFPSELKKRKESATFWALLESLRQSRQIAEVSKRNADAKWKAYLTLTVDSNIKTLSPPVPPFDE